LFDADVPGVAHVNLGSISRLNKSTHNCYA
jgi:hypothetical protein